MKFRSYFQTTIAVAFVVFTLGCNHSLSHIHTSLTLNGTSAAIIGGKEVNLSNPVSHVTVGLEIQRTGFETVCTGVIIFPNVVLTAAHCVDKSPDRVTVVFQTNLDDVEASHKRVVDKQLVHPRWSATRSLDRFDLALVHYDGKTPTGYEPVEPIREEDQLSIGDRVKLAGYGIEDMTTGFGIGTLREYTTEVLSAFGTTEMLIDGRRGGTCYGDSGGPAFVYEKGNLHLWGISSAVTQENCQGLATYTQVLAHGEWIVQGIISLLR